MNSNRAVDAGDVRSRFIAANAGGIRLTGRDEELLTEVFLNRAMTREQIQCKWFGSVTRCNTRLRQLFDHQYLVRHFLPLAPFGAQAIYTAGHEASDIIATQLEMDVREVRRQSRPDRSPSNLEHALAVVHFRLTIEKALSGREDIGLERWIPELFCRHEYDVRKARGGGWRREVFKPDSFFRIELGRPDHYKDFFVEIDRGHTSATEFATKMQIHRRYRESGLFAEIYGQQEFVSLTVTTTERRLLNLCSLAERQQAGSFWFSTFERIERQGPLEKLWTVRANSEPTRLVEADARSLNGRSV